MEVRCESNRLVQLFNSISFQGTDDVARAFLPSFPRPPIPTYLWNICTARKVPGASTSVLMQLGNNYSGIMDEWKFYR